MWGDARGRVLIGHRTLRLAQKEENGQQRQRGPDSDHIVALDGEAYNARQLSEQLGEDGQEVNSVAELLLLAWKRWDNDCFARIDGPFASVLWDAGAERLVLARDPFGEKPIYVARKGSGAYVFASTLSAILVLLGHTPEPHWPALSEYWRYRCIPAPYTAYQGIEAVRPGYWVELTPKGRREGAYRIPSYKVPTPVSFERAVEEAEEVLLKSLERRLVPDMSLGCLLSGGVDSSLVTALTSAEAGRAIRTFSIAFEDPPYSETAYSRRVARRYGTQHEEILLTPEALEVLPDIVWHHGQPFADYSCVPTWHVAEAASQKVRVVLTGDGGDEIFAGYLGVRFLDLLQRYRSAVPRALCAAAAFCARTLALIKQNDVGLRRLSRFCEAGARDPAPAYLSFSESSEGGGKCFTPWACDQGAMFTGGWVSNYFMAERQDELDDFQRGMALLVRGRLPDVFTAKMDVATMAHSVEARTPYLCMDLFDLTCGMPATVLMHHGVRKAVLKKVAEKYLPWDLVYRRKMGFTPPIGEWLASARYAPLLERVLDTSGPVGKWFKHDYLRRLKSAAPSKDVGGALFRMVFYWLWWKMYIAGDQLRGVPLSEVATVCTRGRSGT